MIRAILVGVVFLILVGCSNDVQSYPTYESQYNYITNKFGTKAIVRQDKSSPWMYMVQNPTNGEVWSVSFSCNNPARDCYVIFPAVK